jgi:hypothetical protein
MMPMSRDLGALTLLDPSGPAWHVMGVLYLYLYLYNFYRVLNINMRGTVINLCPPCLHVGCKVLFTSAVSAVCNARNKSLTSK